MEEECLSHKLPEWIGVQTDAGKAALARQFKHFTNDTALLKQRKTPIEIFRWAPNSEDHAKRLDNFGQLFHEIAQLDATLKPLRTGFSPTEKDTFSQLFFTQPALQTLNFIPFFLAILSACKCWIFPAVTMLMPFLSIIIPYITMRFIYQIPISISAYVNMMTDMFRSDSFIKNLFNMATFGATIAQSIIQPYQQACHAQKTNTELLKIAEALKEFVARFTQLRASAAALGIYCPKVLRELDLPVDDSRQLFVYFYEYQHILALVDCWIGDLEVSYRFAVSPDVCLADVYKQPAADLTFLEVEGLYDPSVAVEARVKNSIRLNGKQKGHALLTGPNKGGKSTFLRSLALNCWLAQTFGVAFADTYRGSAFGWVQTSLRLQDIPGQVSRFERECQGAQECLGRIGRGIVLIDELFHSTNPPDGSKASVRFLERLWEKKNTLSIISTHMFELCETVHDNVAVICCAADEGEDGVVSYTYRVEEGICRLSSVEELLVKYGLGRV